LIKQPNAILGNDKLLVTIGKKAEIFGFFYPDRDFAQHIEESQACLYDGTKLIWSTDNEWVSNQRYVEDTNIVHTELHRADGLKVEITDFIHPKLPILVRDYKISSPHGFHGKFFYYSNLQVGEMQKKNSAFCDDDSGILVQYWKNYNLGISAVPKFEEWQIGKALDTIWWTNAKYDMEDGELQKGKEDIGNINNAIGWKLDIAPSSEAKFTVFIGAAPTRQLLYKYLRGVQDESVEGLFNETHDMWIKWLSHKKLIDVPEYAGFEFFKLEIMEAFNRSLLTLSVLNDPKKGAFVAAPEFDHEFEMSGGYGFCWNRDSAEIVISLLNAGYPDFSEKFLKWCRSTQLPDGSWFQRYWLDGTSGPSWGNFNYSTQIDETGSTLFAIEKYYQSLGKNIKTEFLDWMWATILCAAEYLMKRTSGGMHDSCICLWETYAGIFTYTNAAIYAGLVGAAEMAIDYNENDLATRWKERAALIKKTSIEKLWLSEGYFAKGIIQGKLDPIIDASILGTFVPFNMISADDENENKMIYSIIKNIEDKLRVPVNGHFGIKRYENDHYIDGNPWIVTTLWLSKAYLELAKARIKSNGKDAEFNRLVIEALKYIRWALKGRTGAGMLPEQVNKYTGRPSWAIPLCWSCALMLDNITILDELK
jgi:oligosaccharide amylase